jgi:hypothetical protein
MAAVGGEITVGTSATLIFELIDELTWYTLSNPAFNVLKANTPEDPVPLLIVIPSGSTVYLGGAGVTSSSTGVGCPVVGPIILPYNAVGSDSLYGVVASSTATVGLLIQRQ